ncbi:glycine oxidase ThiO [Desmospora profundinema]|uniref:glycine oxidase n=1 Tax=Desmospora profundinema TaxID=1571184 RepID=A0ABU1IKD3_9BACL|nr:glycine oxidase ThiO [Desmospora profundinema]MDR6225007.1 glycine oxidase [Desmospora profundinema]
MSQTSDVVIVGGGVIGCAIAYALAGKGARVTVLERDRIGAHASSAAAGMLGAQVEMAFPGPMVDLCLESRALYPIWQRQLKQETGLDIELQNEGMLRIADTPAEAEALREREGWQRRYGLEAVWLEKESLLQSEPCLSSEWSGALRIPGDGQVSAPRLVQALAQGVRFRGGTVVEGVEVRHVRTTGGRVTEVETTGGTFSFDTVVLSAGAWLSHLASRLEASIPVSPVKGESLALRPARPLFRQTLFGPQGLYLVPKSDGRVIVGATEKAGDVSPGVTAEGAAWLLQESIRMVPELKEAEWTAAWSSYRPRTPDGLPVLGPLSPWENAFVAGGHFRNGILLAPITGVGMAEWIAGEKVPNWGAFAPDRFQKMAISQGEGVEGNDH